MNKLNKPIHAHVVAEKSNTEQTRTSVDANGLKLFMNKPSINSLMLAAAKSSLTILTKYCRQKHMWKKSERQMLFRTLPTTLHQIFCKSTLNSKAIVKSILDPDNDYLS